MLAQILGYIAVSINLISYQFDNKNSIQKLRLLSAVIISIHFYLLSAMTGFAISILVIFRTYSYLKTNENKSILSIFIILFSLSVVITWEGIISLLPLIGTIFGTLAFWYKDPKKIRRTALFCSPPWMIYALITGAYPIILSELINIFSNSVAIYRFDLSKAKERLT